jgi:hypothetical protein
LNLTTQDD